MQLDLIRLASQLMSRKSKTSLMTINIYQIKFILNRQQINHNNQVLPMSKSKMLVGNLAKKGKLQENSFLIRTQKQINLLSSKKVSKHKTTKYIPSYVIMLMIKKNKQTQLKWVIEISIIRSNKTTSLVKMLQRTIIIRWYRIYKVCKMNSRTNKSQCYRIMIK